MEEGGITGWVVDVVDAIGSLGVGLLIFLENIFPPIPSEVILPFAGAAAQDGKINVVFAWIGATAGALGGAYVLYGLGRVIGYDRLYHLAGKRWFVVVGQRDLERGMRYFDRHGGAIVLGGRCVPLVRSVVSIPAGLDRMPLARFTLYTVIGSGIWNALFIALGWHLGARWDTVERWMKPISYTVVAVLAAWVVWLSVRKYRRWSDARSAAAAELAASAHGADHWHPGGDD